MLIAIVNSSGFCVSRSGITLYIHVGEIALMTPPIAHILHLFCLLGAPNNLHPKATQMIEAFDKANQLVNDEVLTTTKA